MNEQDKEAFEKWYDSSLGTHVETWQAALEYSRKRMHQCGCGDIAGQCSCLERELEYERERSKKLVEALEYIIDWNSVEHREVAGEALKEYRGEK